ncbi:HD domain-containing protein [Peribacillus saganii]|uniref:HD domain-containing protein n=1 Tax=Peribacillus saganii TaxID=2303992 RepID=A0A372LP93_9BACI|nr:HD domain-containing protein [Peribacillus saganii]RFU69696.1 HD domain-containing protein [Peribacillus saganii]
MKDIIKRAEAFVKEKTAGDASGHDWHHIDRVRRLSLQIAADETKGDLFLIELAALLHDIPDGKLNKNEEEGWSLLEEWLYNELSPELAVQVREIIKLIPFSAGKTEQLSIEAAIVQDADRIDAIGAIGIARTFAYGGKKGQALYDPSISVRENMSLKEYREGKSSSIHHFYEKLLKLKDIMNTDSAKKIASERQEYMENFLNQFYKEWDVRL